MKFKVLNPSNACCRGLELSGSKFCIRLVIHNPLDFWHIGISGESYLNVGGPYDVDIWFIFSRVMISMGPQFVSTVEDESWK